MQARGQCKGLNHGHESGHVIGIIPGDLDLAAAPIWFGQPGLPERATAKSIRAERALAEESNIQPFSAAIVESVTKAPMDAPDLASLLRGEIAELVLQFSPQEKHLAEQWRLPVATATPDPQ